MLEKSIQSYKDIDAWKKDPIMKQESFDLLQTVMEEAGELDKRAPYDKIINNKFAENAINK